MPVEDRTFRGVITKGGDTGKTYTAFGMLWKSDPLIELIGVVDELDVEIGLLRVNVIDVSQDALQKIQKELKQLMGVLAMGLDSSPDIESLEQWCEWLMPLVPPTEFTYPGDRKDRKNVQQHSCRVMSRRVERRMVSYLQGASMGQDRNLLLRDWQRYLNRLSDYFYLLTLQ